MQNNLPMLLHQLKDAKNSGQIATVIGSLVVGLVLLFVGLFMIDVVDQATNLSATSNFLGVRNSLISTAGQVFTVMGLVLIVVALATAINSLRGVSQ